MQRLVDRLPVDDRAIAVGVIGKEAACTAQYELPAIFDDGKCAPKRRRRLARHARVKGPS